MGERFEHTGTPNLLRDRRSGAYWGKTKVGGRLRRKKFRSAGIREAKRELAAWMAEIQRAAVVRGPGRPPGSHVPTWERACDRWFANLKRRPDLSAHTVDYYSDKMPGIRSLAPPDLSAHRVTEAMAQKWWERTAADHAPHHANVQLSVIRKILAPIVAAGHLSADPTAGLHRLHIPQQRLSLPTTAEFSAIVDALPVSDSRTMLLFLAYSGVRISEARRLTWEDIQRSPTSTTVTITSAKARGGVTRYRRLPANAALAELIEEMWNNLASANIKPTGPLFRIACPRAALNNACTRAGVPHMRIHDLRHLFATRCIEAGVDIPTVSRWLGHSDGGALAMRTYGHLRDDHSRAQMARVTF